MGLFDIFLTEWATIPEMLRMTLSWPILPLIILGTAIGIVVGVLPGLSAVMAMALLLGFVFRIPFELGWGLLISVYVGAIYAGGITATMINIPGTPGAVATCVDGFPLAKKGKARETIGLVTVGSGFGEILGESIMYLLLPVVTSIALAFGDWELALVCLIGIILAGALAGDNPLKGWIAGIFGLFIAMVGLEPIFAYPRFNYHPVLLRGFDFVPILIGLFGVSEVLLVLKDKVPYELVGKPARALIPPGELKKNTRNIIRSALIGIGIGMIPGTGESVAPWVAYSFAQRASKHKDLFGKGSYEGVLAAEVSNNATSGGALIPTMVLGVPGSGPAAILLASLFIYGYRPGPLLIIESPGILTLTVLFFIASAAGMIIMGLLLSKYIISFLYMPREIILPVILVLGTIGAWTANFTLFDVSVMFAFGILGCILRARNFPLAPMILGVLIGGIFDNYLRRALLTYVNRPMEMLTRPIGLVLIFLMFFLLYTTFVVKKKTELQKDMVQEKQDLDIS